MLPANDLARTAKASLPHSKRKKTAASRPSLYVALTWYIIPWYLVRTSYCKIGSTLFPSSLSPNTWVELYKGCYNCYRGIHNPKLFVSTVFSTVSTIVAVAPAVVSVVPTAVSVVPTVVYVVPTVVSVVPTVVSVVPTVVSAVGLQFAVCTSYHFHRFCLSSLLAKTQNLSCVPDPPSVFHSELDVRFLPPEIGRQPLFYKKALYKRPSQHLICVLVESTSSGSLCPGNQPTHPLLPLVLFSRVTIYLHI